MSLPDTGGPATTWLIAGLVCLGAGLLIVRRGGGGDRHGVSRTALLVIAAGCLVSQPSAGQAADDCEAPGKPAVGRHHPYVLVITQTSIIEGLAPSVSPVTIAGRVTNTSREPTYVTHVTVRISSITQAARSAPGRCSTADYVVSASHMPVDRPVPALSSVPFSGATIGFRNSSRNQDACKRATIHLEYVSTTR